MQFITHSVEETEALGKRLAKLVQSPVFIALYGGLGAGKTAFTRGFVGALGYDDVSSPTFTIVHEYDSIPPVYHFDVYRFLNETNIDELYFVGFDDYLRCNGIIIMEWPERVESILPKDRINIRMETLSETSRSIHIDGLSKNEYEGLNGYECEK